MLSMLAYAYLQVSYSELTLMAAETPWGTHASRYTCFKLARADVACRYFVPNPSFSGQKGAGERAPTFNSGSVLTTSCLQTAFVRVCLFTCALRALCVLCVCALSCHSCQM